MAADRPPVTFRHQALSSKPRNAVPSLSSSPKAPSSATRPSSRTITRSNLEAIPARFTIHTMPGAHAPRGLFRQPVLGQRIEGRGGFAEDHQVRAFEQGPGDSQLLPLTRRKTRAADPTSNSSPASRTAPRRPPRPARRGADPRSDRGDGSGVHSWGGKYLFCSQPPYRAMGTCPCDKLTQEVGGFSVEHSVVRHQAGGLFPIGRAGATGRQMGDGVTQNGFDPEKSAGASRALAAPVHQIDMHIVGAQPGNRIGSRPRTDGAQAAKAQFGQERDQMRGDPVPGGTRTGRWPGKDSSAWAPVARSPIT